MKPQKCPAAIKMINPCYETWAFAKKTVTAHKSLSVYFALIALYKFTGNV